MSLNFAIEEVTHTEYGVGRDIGGKQIFYVVPVGANAQRALGEMVGATWIDMQESVVGSATQMEFKETVLDDVESFAVVSNSQEMQKRLAGGPSPYEPSQKYGGNEYIYISIDDPKVSALEKLHSATNMDTDSQVFDDTDSIFCYFARLTDKQQRRLTAIRRATGLKGILKKKSLTWDAGVLDLFQQKQFVLDRDFDILIDSASVHIWRPSSFESVGRLQKEILASVAENISAIRQDIDFVDFKPIEAYASSHIMAARYLASIRAQNTQGPISKSALVRLCEITGVMIEDDDGKLVVAPEHFMGFLEVLDRRRYEIELVEGNPERFRATSRQRLNLALT